MLCCHHAPPYVCSNIISIRFLRSSQLIDVSILLYMYIPSRGFLALYHNNIKPLPLSDANINYEIVILIIITRIFCMVTETRSWTGWSGLRLSSPLFSIYWYGFLCFYYTYHCNLKHSLAFVLGKHLHCNLLTSVGNLNPDVSIGSLYIRFVVPKVYWWNVVTIFILFSSHLLTRGLVHVRNCIYAP